MGLLLWTACAHRVEPLQPESEWTGFASYYGEKFHGRKTASGERYDMNALTAAHRTLPFGTRVRVTNLSNQKSVVVRVNDRGPFVRGRVIDVSVKGAEALDLTGPGTARVQIEVVTERTIPPAVSENPSRGAQFFIQTGSFRTRENAETLRQTLKDQFPTYPIYIQSGEGYNRVVVGPESDETKVASWTEKLQAAGYTAIILRR